MEQFAFDAGSWLLLATPLLILAKIMHGVATQRISLAPFGTRLAKVEAVTWLLIVAVDFHMLALWSSFANQPEDVCGRYRPEMGADVRLTDGHIFGFPVEIRCVWPGGHSANLVPWPLNAATAVFFTAALGVAAHASVRAYLGRCARQHSTR